MRVLLPSLNSVYLQLHLLSENSNAFDITAMIPSQGDFADADSSREPWGNRAANRRSTPGRRFLVQNRIGRIS